MESKINPIGKYITPINEKNKNNLYSTVLGVAIEKEFMPSVANLNGTDLSKYSILRKGRFAFNPMHVGRDLKLPVAMYKKDEPALVSPAYSIFEVTCNELLSEYLELILKSNNFDHLCWFHTDASVRGGLSWDDFADLNINVPSIQEQEKIVYNCKVIEDRIELLKKMKNKYYNLVNLIYSNIKTNNLVSMIEFPNLKEINSSISKFTGLKKYIATGNIDFDEVLNDCVNVDYDNRPSRANMEPRSKSIWFAKMQNTDKYLFFDDLSFEDNLIILSTGFMGIQCNSDLIYYLNSFVLTKEFVNQKNKFATGTTQIAINSSALNQIKVPLPKESIDKELKTLKCLFLNIKNLNKEIDLLLLFKNCMLSNLTKEE